jgi:hypothetical protein
MSTRSCTPVLAMLALSHALTIAVFVATLIVFRFSAINLFAMLVLPLGAMCFGILGSLGAIPGARMAQFAPGGSLARLIATAAAISFAVYLLLIAALTNLGAAAHPGVLFTLLHNETEADYVLTRGMRQIGDAGRVGAWGYVLLALKFAGAISGALMTHSVLKLLPYCRKCAVFTRTRERGTVHFRSLEAWAGAMCEMPREPWQRAREVLALPRQKALSTAGRYYVLVRLRRHECPECHEQHMRERVFVHTGSALSEKKQLSSQYSWMPADALSHRRPVPPKPTRAGFGRKVA